MVFGNKTYDHIKWVAQYLLPALATLWLTLGKIWSFPYTTEVGATLSAIDIFLGALLGISKKNYNGDGQIVINDSDPEKDVFTLEMEDDLATIPEKDFITLKVVNNK